MIKTILTSFCIVFLLNIASAQIGIRAGYDQNSYDGWSDAVGMDILTTGNTVGIDYWFRLKKRRIEFMPELSYSSAKSSALLVSRDDVTANSFNFFFNTHFYPMDFEEDCDCPTFSKDGTLISKGFFFHLAPGIGFYTVDDGGGMDESIIAYKFRGGVGLDIGLNDFLTLTPMVGYTFTPKLDWIGLSDLEGQVSSTETKLNFGIRVGITLPERKRY